jgi:hypothetical protein
MIHVRRRNGETGRAEVCKREEQCGRVDASRHGHENRAGSDLLVHEELPQSLCNHSV